MNLFHRAAVTVASLSSLWHTAAADGLFHSELQLCPQTCTASGTDSGNWTRYHDTRALTNCKEPMMLSFLVDNPVQDPTTDLSLFACVGGLPANGATCSREPHINTTRASGTQTPNDQVAVEVLWSEATDNPTSGSSLDAVEQVQDYLFKANCESTEPSIGFSYHNGSFVGTYAGAGMRPESAANLLEQYKREMHNNAKGNHLVMQVCGDGRSAWDTIGIVLSTPVSAGDIEALGKVQEAVRSWNRGECVNSSAAASKLESTVKISRRQHLPSGTLLSKRDDCKTEQVRGGDLCGAIADRCGITLDELKQYNSADDTWCNRLSVGQYVCCGSGSLPDMRPKPNADGTCKAYTVKDGEYCGLIAAANSLTVDELESLNKNTWGWTGCGNLQKQARICLSSGDPPMPVWIPDVECGPQKPGTRRPTDGTKLADLNPCPLNVCCTKWGHCGYTKDYCTQEDSETGAPGTSKPGTNGCISNCGMEIIVDPNPSPKFNKLGYFEAFNSKRKCLNMDVRALQGLGHDIVHFAFATITQDFQVDISPLQDSFNNFVSMSASFKKIISFGGWTFSTDADSFPIFRNVVTDANREAFANNVVDFVVKNSLDGVDFDWEYPGAPDIPGVPAGDKDDGKRYLEFLKLVKNKLPSGKTVSIAAPGSYWYLRGFPIADMSKVVDYIVFMSYDLHGQWDFEKPWAAEGCHGGSCLRSHINSTETEQALVMITKAGVSTTKIFVGVSSYGRSFQMTDPSCTGPDCTFTGPESGATPGECTDTAGYISNAEIKDLLASKGGSVKYDAGSDSYIATYGDNWVAYMDESIKTSRMKKYKSLNMGGTTDWAVDLSDYMVPFDNTNIEYNGIDFRRVSCQDISNIDEEPAVAWAKAGCPAAYGAAVKYWRQPHSSRNEFSQIVAQFFNDSGHALSMKCGRLDLGSAGCQDHADCKDTAGPAGQLILASMMNIHSMYLNTYEAIDAAKRHVADYLDKIESTFAKPPDGNEAAQLVLGLLEQVWSSVVAPRLAKFLEGQTLKGSEEKAWKAYQTGVDLAFDQIKQAQSEKVTASNSLKENLVAMVDLLLAGMQAMNNATFDGSEASTDTLYNMISDGKAFLAKAPGSGMFDTQSTIQNTLLAALIPAAWAYAKDNVQGHGAVVVSTKYDCKATDKCPDRDPAWPNTALLTTWSAQNSCYCYKGKWHFLVQMWGGAITFNSGGGGAQTHDPTPFSGPNGFEKMSDFGISGKDFIEGALRTWEANGGKNGYKPDFQSIEGLQSFVSGDIRTPGIVNVPVCDIYAAHTGWEKDLESRKLKHFPCPDDS